MVETYSFRSRIAEMVGGRAGVLETARDLLKTYPVTAALATKHDIDRDVLEIVVTAIKQRMRPILIAELTEYLGAVEDEHVLFFGPTPDASERKWWMRTLHDAQFEALRGEVEDVLGFDDLQKICYGEGSIEELVDAMLAKPPSSIDHWLQVVGVTPGDVEDLAASVREKLKALGVMSEKTAETVLAPDAARKKAPRRSKDQYVSEAVDAFTLASGLSGEGVREGVLAALAVVGR